MFRISKRFAFIDPLSRISMQKYLCELFVISKIGNHFKNQCEIVIYALLCINYSKFPIRATPLMWHSFTSFTDVYFLHSVQNRHLSQPNFAFLGVKSFELRYCLLGHFKENSKMAKQGISSLVKVISSKYNKFNITVVASH